MKLWPAIAMVFVHAASGARSAFSLKMISSPSAISMRAPGKLPVTFRPRYAPPSHASKFMAASIVAFFTSPISRMGYQYCSNSRLS